MYKPKTSGKYGASIMIKKVQIKNYRSLYEAEATLSPFTLILGANGAGKSNFLGSFSELSTRRERTNSKLTGRMFGHFNHIDEPVQMRCIFDDGQESKFGYKDLRSAGERRSFLPPEYTRLFRFDPKNAGAIESIQADSTVGPDGHGVVNVLDQLKTGDREDLFEQLEQFLKKQVPEIEKLSTVVVENKKRLQIREKHIAEPIPVAFASEGTQLLILVLAVVFQEDPPKLICLEDIDRGMHPRLYQRLVEMLKDLTRERDIQIIASTHNPYLLDQFAGDEESVLIIEKENGKSTITSLADRLEEGDTAEAALGELWYGGFLGGVPAQAKP